jgi:hypothetical protein
MFSSIARIIKNAERGGFINSATSGVHFPSANPVKAKVFTMLSIGNPVIISLSTCSNLSGSSIIGITILSTASSTSVISGGFSHAHFPGSSVKD